MAGKAATGIVNQTLLATFQSAMQAATSEAQVVRALYDAESSLVATYTAGLAQLIGTNPAALVGSIQPIEARHATVLGQALNVPSDQYSPTFESIAAALSPTQFPIVAR